MDAIILCTCPVERRYRAVVTFICKYDHNILIIFLFCSSFNEVPERPENAVTIKPMYARKNGKPPVCSHFSFLFPFYFYQRCCQAIIRKEKEGTEDENLKVFDLKLKHKFYFSFTKNGRGIINFKIKNSV